MRNDHYDDPRAVRARLNGYQETEVCECTACRAAMVSEPPVLVPAVYQNGAGEYLTAGKWLHGLELVAHLKARRAFTEAMARWGAKRDTSEATPVTETWVDVEADTEGS